MRSSRNPILPFGNKLFTLKIKHLFTTKHYITSLVLLLAVFAAKAQAPTPGFTMSKSSGCSPLVINFYNTSTSVTGSFTSTWDLGNGQFLTTKDAYAAYYYIPGGNNHYTITLNVRNEHGVSQVSKEIDVLPSPIADFAVSQNVGCTPTTINFTNNSYLPGGGTLTYLWDFGDGTTSTQTNPQHVYSNVGYYNVSLTVTSPNGCSTVVAKNRVIRMIGSVSPNFDFKMGSICNVPVDVSFVNQTAGAGNMTYQWTLGNGTQSGAINPNTSYPAYGTYNVKLVATSSYGCRDSITKPITLKENITSFSAPNSICPGAGVQFTNTGSTPVSSFWDFGDGTSARGNSPTKSYAVPGTYTVTLTNQYAECTGTATKTVTVAPPPPLNFLVQNDTGCSTPHTTQFSDTTIGSSNWFWDFGDGSTSTLKNPSHTYATTGNYTVTLTLTTAGGCTASATKANAVVIRNNATVSLTAPAFGGCVPFNFTPTANVNAVDGVASYQWSFGDGTTGTGQSPTHIYGAVGNYIIKLTITTRKGCVINYQYPDTINVGTPPTVDFTAASTDVCAADSTQFTSLATPADTWMWDFGDGSTSGDEHPKHQFEDIGPMTISLTAINNGCAATATKNNYINSRGPVARFLVHPNCADPRQVVFEDISVEDPAPTAPVTYTWDFGDGTTQPGAYHANTAHTYVSVGTRTVTLTADNGSCHYVYSLPVDLFNLQPVITASKANPICRNEGLRLTATNMLANRVKSYAWQLNGQPAGIGLSTFDTTLTTNGSYHVVLTVTDIYDCLHTAAYDIVIGGPIVDFTVTNNGGCRNAAIGINVTETPANSIQTWAFDFGDGSTATYTNNGPFNHVYTNVGSYNIKLLATDNAGCTAAVNKAAAAAITYPVANFTAEDSLYCQGTNVQFVNNTTGINMSYQWSYGDGTTSTDRDPVHVYTGVDSFYTVRLVATDANGCSDTLTKQRMIRIVAPKFTMSATDTASICPPLQTQFFSTTENAESVRWNFGDGNISTLPNPGYFYDNFGSYVAKLYVIGYHGCVDSAQQTINLYNPQATTSINFGGPLTGCNTVNANFTITVPPSTRFMLYFNDGSIDSSQNTTVSHLYARPGIYLPYVELTDSLDCKIVVTAQTQVTVNGVYPDFNVSKKEFCDQGTVTFTDYSLFGRDTITSRVWDMGDGTTLNGKEVTHSFTQPGTYYVTEQLTTRAGCTNSKTDTIRVYRTPQPVISGPAALCLGAVAQFNASTVIADTAIYWRWTLENRDTSNQSVVLRNFPAAGQYTLQLYAQNKLGCGNDTSFAVTVHGLPLITNDPVITTPVGIPVTLPVSYSSGVVDYNWTPATDLSCTDCPQPTASPRFNTTYKVEVVDSNNCRASSSILVKTVCNDQNYFVPNTFSPNGDGQNDVFYPRGTQLNRIQAMRVFNRWGELVFEKKNFSANVKNDGWDGYVRGVPGQMDTYVYIIEIVCENAQIIALKGNVTLIR